ncbi:MAG: cell division protein ZapA [Clostridiales bacterium]|nr:cell division protein ZapA [Clostridiales bacterium]
MEKKKVQLRVAGREYTLLSSDPPEQVHRVGIYVDRKIAEIEQATRLPSNMVAVLTALNLGNDLLKAQDENTRLRRELTLARKAMEQTHKQSRKEKEE